MASEAATSHSPPPTSLPAGISPSDLQSFHEVLGKSKRILALLGAGLSASSGLPTFRGAGGLWRTHDAMDLATPEAFDHNPGLVWQFYSYRRHMALKARPNRAHYALAELARKREGFECLSQNVDGLSQRAGHPREKLHLLHGSLYDIKCTDFYCKYGEQDNFTDPIVPALAIPKGPKGEEIDPTTDAARSQAEESETNGHNGSASEEDELDIADENVAIPNLTADDLPKCPDCRTGMLRPGVVWFGEMLPERVIKNVDDWIVSSSKIDLILVIGTSARVYPAAGYVQRARAKGARVAVVNTDQGDVPEGGMMKGDWFFVGDASVIVPKLLEPVVGDLSNIPQKNAGDVGEDAAGSPDSMAAHADDMSVRS